MSATRSERGGLGTPRAGGAATAARQKSRPAGDSFKDFVLDQLDGLGPVEARAMFGGHGIYLGGEFFAIVFKGRLYFRVGPATVPEYESRVMKPFRPYRGKVTRGYYEVPPDVLDDAASLRRWARAACAARR